MKIRALYILTLLPAMLMESCEKDLDFKYKTISPLTVIEAAVDGDVARVAVMETAPMDEPLNKTLYTDAEVAVTDLDTGAIFNLHPDETGMFLSKIVAETGHRYELQVSRNGKNYKSVAQMYAPVEMIGLEFSWVSMPYDDVAALQVSFYDSDPVNNGDCYWIRISRNGEAYMWETVRDNQSRDGRIDVVARTSRRDTDAEDEATVLRPGDRVTAAVCRISPEMYDYLNALASDSNGNPMFAGDLCLGYFLASATSESTIIYTADF